MRRTAAVIITTSGGDGSSGDHESYSFNEVGIEGGPASILSEMDKAVLLKVLRGTALLVCHCRHLSISSALTTVQHV